MRRSQCVLVTAIVSISLGALTACGTGEPKSPEAIQSSKLDHPKSEVPGSDPRPAPREITGFELAQAPSDEIQAATRGSFAPVPLAPSLGRLYEMTPVFFWSYAGAAETFEFVLLNADQEQIYHATVNGRSLKYPVQAPSLEPGRTYCWTIQASTSPTESTPSQAWFNLLSKEKRSEIEEELKKATSPDPYANLSARADIFTRHRLWYDVIGVYSELIGRFPDRPEPYERRGEIYYQLSATKGLSDQDLAYAEKLHGAAGIN